ncbi:MAG TPA: T9SS type A sorting domain-containing protein, partial [Puia sp.]|nr:T9SS type A sorting domain-containing protein [Puia sp.]
TIQWQNSIGGNSTDYLNSIQQTSDGGFILGGYSSSAISGDKTEASLGFADYWAVKLYGTVPVNSIVTSTISPLSYFQTDPVNVSYTASGTFSAGNIFTAQLSDASGSFVLPIAIGTLASTTSGMIAATIPLATPAGTGYRIRVVSSNPIIIGSNNGENITINALTCDVPAGEFTSNITSTTAKTNWIAISSANKYNIRYRVSGTTAWTRVSSTTNFKKLNNLSASTQYDWQVQSICTSAGLGKSNWSTIQNFTTNPLRFSSPVETSLEVYPNPIASAATITFTLTQSENVSIRLISAEGKEVMTIANGNFSEGNHEVNFNRQSLAAGIYFLQFKTNHEMTTRKVVIN